jgi:two-component system, OmpR family, response regulator
MARVGVCEDDPAIRRILVHGLRMHEHEPVVAHNGAEAVRLFARDERVDVLVLDIGLPDSDGRDVCVALRSAGQMAPALFLTALDQMHEKLAAFAVGADDYLTKPFEVAELMVRVEALTRRLPLARPASGELILDPARHSVVYADAGVLLTPTEFRMLAAVTSRPGEVVRRRVVIAAAWPDGAQVHDNTVDSYATRIRRKLERVGSPIQLRTVRGVGFELR